ncbi:N-acetylmuramoyl-L-alanine amidase [Candidatus Blochmanniella vafra str. BVAF]|uniref:N-acetylmuramoyl-L-alanine amidase n=2 Tax=Candidatus Blochmanniella vafra TaxID=251535 RepID=E8Q6P6_BLOVB|nr:N-acetylmuramoyl-L-alanine amidase [Candidatus Blochmannia vafer str. BVAF]
MKLKNKIIFFILILSKCLFFNIIYASTALHSIYIKNNIRQSTVIIYCNTTVPEYTVFYLHHPERIVIDLLNIPNVQKKNTFPIACNKNNLIKCVRSNTSVNCNGTRIVCDLNHPSYIKVVIQKKIKKNYQVILKIVRKTSIASHLNVRNLYNNIIQRQKSCITTIYSKLMVSNGDTDSVKGINNRNSISLSSSKHYFNNNSGVYHSKSQNQFPIIVAIDAGHGGQDPGAIGFHGTYEKNITLSIAKKLKKLLDTDLRFKAVMIRNGDNFVSITDRADLARKKRANILISIHTDASVNSKVKGASVWVLSNHRAHIETIHWLKCKEKYAELLGGLGQILNNYRNDPYFQYLILDLQFGYTQKAGYNIAMHMLHQLKNVGILHKDIPEYSSFGVLRSPDIPSILVETGFISNFKEEKLLITDTYQRKIAQALYMGLRAHFLVLLHQHQQKIMSNHI